MNDPVVSSRQPRALITRRKIIGAAIHTLAESGLASLTHRAIAQGASVSLAATTYHYQTKAEIVADALQFIVEGYSETLVSAMSKLEATDGLINPAREFVIEACENAATSQREWVIALLEITLDATRHNQRETVESQWIHQLESMLERVFAQEGQQHSSALARSTIDQLIGLVFFTVTLGLSMDQIKKALREGAAPWDKWNKRVHSAQVDNVPVVKTGAKSQDTRERIIQAAIAILIADGAPAITFRSVAASAQLTPAALPYHFASVDDLLEAAQHELFGLSKRRYRNIFSDIEYRNMSFEQFSDMISVVFIREATEFGPLNLATFSIRLEAARRTALQSVAWSTIVDHLQASQELLEAFRPDIPAYSGLLYHCMFFGKLLRVLAAGSSNRDLVNIRKEFNADLTALFAGSLWA